MQFATVFFLVFSAVTVNGSKLNHLTRFFGLSLDKREWFGLSCITTTLNNLFFKAGSLATSNYLKRKHAFPYMSFLGSLGADQLILFFMSALTGGMISFYLMLTATASLNLAALTYLGLTLVLFFSVRLVPQMRSRSHPLLDALVRAVNALNRILKDRPLFVSLCVHNALLIALTALRFFAVCKILRLDVPLQYCLLFTTVMIFVSAVPLFQSDIGSREIAVGFLSQLAGMGFNEGLLATFVDRVFVFSLTLLATLCFRNLLVPPLPQAQKS